ncbi:MAG: hypothetical protein K9H26_04795 [Prolixibacteraceae bacterium]|nr:hypothetical protein [Prolixibacteraceae bacterium]
MDKNIANNLKSDNYELISKSLESIKKSGSVDYLPLLFEALHKTPFEEIKNLVTKILSQLKSSESVPYFINALNNEKYENEREILIKSCWENGLDYSDYIPVFVNIMTKGNYMESLESLTLIENSEFKISEKEYKKISRQILKSMDNLPNNHKKLLDEAIKVLESKIE